jgi:hypothetical protein
MEWRIFKPVNDTTFDKKLAQSKMGRKWEHRTDLYIALPDVSLGLKIRGENEKPKIELKVRSARSENGVEQWDKIIHSKLTKPIFENESIKQSTLQEILTVLGNSRIDSVEKCHTQLKQAIDSKNVKLVRVEKIRKKSGGMFSSKEGAYVRCTVLHTNTDHYFKSIAIEGKSSIPTEVEQKYATLHKQGYPELVWSL